MNRDAALVLDMYLNRPAQYAQMLGYSSMTDKLHGRWIQSMVLRHGDQTLQAHRGSYKTTCICVALAIMMQINGDKTIMFLRKTDSDVAEVVRNVMRILDHPVTQASFMALTGKPLTISKSTYNEITTSAYTAPRGASQLLGIGIGGSITGKHADIIITDDIVNRQDRTSPAERARTRQAYQELQNILIPGGRFINSGTPWHREDAFQMMPPPQKYDCYSTGMLTAEQIEKLRRSMEPSLFAANYELRHIASGNALFNEMPTTGADPTLVANGIAHIDAAYGGEDYTALTCAKKVGDTIYIYGRLWQRHIDTVMDAIMADCDRLMCSPIYCETNGDKGYLAKEIKLRGRIAHAYPERQNKYLKIATCLRKWWTNIVFLQGTDREYIDQIMEYNETAVHDDAPDSAACVCRILDRTRLL